MSDQSAERARANGEVLLARSPFCPPGQAFVFNVPEHQPTIVVGTDFPEEQYEVARKAVGAHNAMARAIGDWKRIEARAEAGAKEASIPDLVKKLRGSTA